MAQNDRLSMRDSDKKLRKAASEINSLLTGGASEDYAGGVRYALFRTLAEMKREAKQRRAQAQKAEQAK